MADLPPIPRPARNPYREGPQARRDDFCRNAVDILMNGDPDDAKRLRDQLRLPEGLSASELPAAVRAAVVMIESGAWRILGR